MGATRIGQIIYVFTYKEIFRTCYVRPVQYKSDILNGLFTWKIILIMMELPSLWKMNTQLVINLLLFTYLTILIA